MKITIPIRFSGMLRMFQGTRYALLYYVLSALFVLALLPHKTFSQTGSSAWISIGEDGKLQYTPDAKANTIPDFSMVGYKNGDQEIPIVPVVKTLTAVSGDNLMQIQTAINDIAALPLNTNGFRGAILLKAGEYNVSNTISIRASGIVLRGEGNSTNGTRIIATRTAQHTVINVLGTGTPAEVSGTRQKISDAYVPVGTKSFQVESTTGYAVGDKIILLIEPKDSWIALLNMAQYGWTASGYKMSYLRVITKIEGNKVYIDAPVVDPIDVTYKNGYIYKYSWSKIENIGVENIRFSSVFSSTQDENHAWTAIAIDRAQHCWVRNSNFYHFGYSAIDIKDWGVNVSVLNCQNIDPMSITTGDRKYSFNVNGQLSLVKDCYTHGGRHDYVTGSTTSGPNAFVNCRADSMLADIGPHHRWATGSLYDNIISTGEQNVQNRGASGSGHGWAGAQNVFWNCTASKFRNQSPPEHFNWAIGCKGIVTDDGVFVDGNPGIWESTGNFIGGIQGLYERQLSDRLNIVPTVSITAPVHNSIFIAPANIVIGASAADSDGIITKVEFFQGSTKLGEDFTSPYSFTWSSVAVGTYVLTAKATDSNGAIKTSSSVSITVNPNQAPSVSITSPVDGATFVAPATVTINATASDSDGTITKVEFFQGTTKLGEDLTSPYSFTWSSVAVGTYVLTAKATDSNGAIKTSSNVSIIVNPNQAPSVSIASPVSGATFVAPATVTINATASDSDGTITKVEFFQGTTKLGEDITSPYNFVWSNVVSGSYTLTAKATDNLGATRTSSSVSITVNQVPTVSITSPVSGATLVAPATVTINATASDSDGTITKVEFFQGTTKLGEDITSPYNFVWSNVVSGSYTLTAKATDNLGATRTSSSVSITVNQVPTVSITSPVSGATLVAPATVTINATASDSDGTITKVEFFQGTTKLGEDITSPYNFVWSNVVSGSYTLTAKATDNLGATRTSSSVSITVNQVPTVSITSPVSGATFVAPATVTINATASDSDGTITKVEFFRGTTKLGEDLTSPYNFTWSTVAAGSYTLTAKATDNRSSVSTSQVVSITVNTIPLPAPWLNNDIGSVGAVGSAKLSSGTFTLAGSGADIGGVSDEFHYVYQSLSGDGEIIARVVSLQNTNTAAKAGVMIRESLAANSTHASVFATPSSGILFQRRTTTGGTSVNTTATGTAPSWLRMKRVGSSLTAFNSADGITWAVIGSVTITMSNTVQIGLAISSRADGTLTSASFNNVSVVGSCEPVIASADDGNVAANVLDNNFDTRWSASGDGPWIQFCLNNMSSISGVQISFYKGNERQAIFDVLVSSNGTNWTPAALGLRSSGTSLALEVFSFPSQVGRYVRIVGHGNNLNLWNSMTEVRINSVLSTGRLADILSIETYSSADVLQEVSFPANAIINVYPNPAKDHVLVNYVVKKSGRVKLSIHNAGNHIENALVDGYMQEGTHEVIIDLKSFPAGVHILKFIREEKIEIQKILKI
jgi:hypothetical protein